MWRKYLGGIALYIGTVIGAGIFGIPYAVAQVGFWPGMVLLFLLAIISVYTTLAYVDLIFHAPKKLQFSGIIRTYLGNTGFVFAFMTMLFGMYGVMLAYITEIGPLLSEVINPLITIDGKILSILFYAVACVLIAFGIKSIVRTEIIFVVIIIIVILAFGILAIPHIDPSHYMSMNVSKWPLAYGVLLFALLGVSSIPDIVSLMQRKKKAVKRVIWIGTLIPGVLYAIFSFSVVGVVGLATTQSAIIGFGAVLGPAVLRIGALLGVLTMATSFLISGFVLREMYELDLKHPRLLAFFLAMTPPLLLYLFGNPQFINVISLVGAIVMGTLAIIVLLAWRKLHQKKGKGLILYLPRPFFWLILLIFAIGFIYELAALFT